MEDPAHGIVHLGYRIGAVLFVLQRMVDTVSMTSSLSFVLDVAPLIETTPSPPGIAVHPSAIDRVLDISVN